jgi:concanavalin A-like lectin/glucanase superfamily protein
MDIVFLNSSFGDFGPVADLALCNPHFGDFWSLLDGCHAVYRGQNGNIDYTEVQALMGIDDSEVTIDYQDLPPGTSWDYIRQQVSGCGLASEDSVPICKILIDENGDAFAEVPNPPLSLTATAVAGGKIKLRWRYSAVNQKIKPTCFNVYYDDGLGSAYIGDDSAVDPDAVLILHFDGTDGATSVIDTSGSGHTVTTSGDFELDDAQVKFGNTSGKLTGTNTKIVIGDHADFNFADDDFTTMGWLQVEKNDSQSGFFYLLRQHDDVWNFNELRYYHDIDIPDNSYISFSSLNLSSGTGISMSSYGAGENLADGNWHHICLTRNGNDWKLFLDGKLKESKTHVHTMPDLAADVNIYASLVADILWVDDLIVTKQALYTAAFDVPTRAYGACLGDVKARGSGEYSFVTEALTHGKTYNFRARSYNKNNNESQNSDYVSITADAVGPDAITDLRASWTEK